MAAKRRTYIFVVGGVMSGVGKGVAAASIGRVLTARGLTVTALKIDPYVNVDAGTMNPTEHGEVFVLQSGLETDQDMGNYERFLNTTIPGHNYMTTGSVYQELIRRERALEFNGRNVEVVPDVPLQVIKQIKEAAEKANADVTLIEIGGTVGEYQNMLFLEAARMMKSKMPDQVQVVMVSYLPTPSKIGEMKTKPTQYAARTLNSAGIQADIIIGRSNVPIDHKRKEKIALFCNVPTECVISAPDVDSIYDVPLNFERDHLGDILCKRLSLGKKCKAPDYTDWKKFVSRSKSVSKPLNIAVVGKYFQSGDFVLSDVYISILEALKFSSYAIGYKPVIHYLSSVDFEKGTRKLTDLKKYDGILIPGGFGSTGIGGKLAVIEYARKNKIPYFGICYGMQLMVIEYARNVLKWKDAHTLEIDPATSHPVIHIMHDQRQKLATKDMGGSMRLGSYKAFLRPGTIAAKSYGAKEIIERHRHRYEVNPEYVDAIQQAGLVFSGTSPDGRLMEIAELPQNVHPFFVGAQFHPEFLARPLTPHPLFTAFLRAASKRAN